MQDYYGHTVDKGSCTMLGIPWNNSILSNLEPVQGSLNISEYRKNDAKNITLKNQKNKLHEVAGIQEQFWVSCQSPGWARGRVLAGLVE